MSGVEECYEHAACALLTLTPDGKIEQANRTTCTWTEQTLDALRGRPFQDLLTIDSKLFSQTQWWPLIALQGSVAEVQLELALPDRRSEPILVNAVRRTDQRIDVAFIIAADRRKSTVLTGALNDRERAARRSADVAEQFVGIVSHDLRNPLNAIMMGAHLLASGGVAAQERVVGRILASANRATRLIADLLDFTQARLGSGLPVNPIEIDLHALVTETVDELRLASSGRVIEHRKVGQGRGFADPDRIAQVVSNLVGNAITYGAPSEPITVTSEVAKETLAVRVHNRGTPIPPELVADIFEPLRRGDEQMQRGSRSVGLGLFIVREIATAHGGHVTVTSTADDGTTFLVELPLAQSQRA